MTRETERPLDLRQALALVPERDAFVVAAALDHLAATLDEANAALAGDEMNDMDMYVRAGGRWGEPIGRDEVDELTRQVGGG